jgi:predicted negative regulator of RcsB-dependent stress response
VELLSEEEQWDRLKAWLRTNGPSVLVLTALMLLGWFGWKWWQERGQARDVAAGAAYQSIIGIFDSGEADLALAQIETLRSDYPDSPYVAAADLLAANVFVVANELDNAEERLQRVASSAPDELLRPIARLRLARVQSAKGDYEAALATLGTANMGVHEPARLEVRGDVLLASGDRDGALREYEAARLLLPEVEQGEGEVGELLGLKIADLGGAPLAPAAADAGVEAADAAAAAAEGTTP